MKCLTAKIPIKGPSPKPGGARPEARQILLRLDRIGKAALESVRQHVDWPGRAPVTGFVRAATRQAVAKAHRDGPP